jgi:chromosome segregation ATPase
MQYYGLGALVVVILALGAAVAYLAMLLVQASTDLDTTTVALSEETSTNTVLEQANRVLLTDRARLEVYLEAATDRYGEVSSENVSLQSDLVAEKDQYTLLDTELTSLQSRHDELASAHDALLDRHDALESDYDDLAARHEDLSDRYAEVQRLARNILELRERIADLEVQLASSGGR